MLVVSAWWWWERTVRVEALSCVGCFGGVRPGQREGKAQAAALRRRPRQRAQAARCETSSSPRRTRALSPGCGRGWCVVRCDTFRQRGGRGRESAGCVLGVCVRVREAWWRLVCHLDSHLKRQASTPTHHLSPHLNASWCHLVRCLAAAMRLRKSLTGRREVSCGRRACPRCGARGGVVECAHAEPTPAAACGV